MKPFKALLKHGITGGKRTEVIVIAVVGSPFMGATPQAVYLLGDKLKFQPADLLTYRREHSRSEGIQMPGR